MTIVDLFQTIDRIVIATRVSGSFIHNGKMILAVDEQLAEGLGYSPEDLIGGDVLRFIPQEYRPMIRQRHQLGTMTPVNLHIQRRDYSRLWMQASVKRIHLQGEDILRRIELREIS